MKVLLINGSPRSNGCTYTALKEIEKTLKEEGIDSEIFQVGNKPIAGCIGCGSCKKLGRCFRDDDGVNECLEKVKECDGLIVGSPVHFASASGAITSFLDRLFYAGSAKDFANKPAASIVSCRRGGASFTFDQLNKYFSIRNMPQVNSNYWNMVHGNTPEEVVKDEEGMQTMRMLARNMAWLLKCIEAGKNAGVELPKPEKKIQTNFIR